MEGICLVIVIEGDPEPILGRGGFTMRLMRLKLGSPTSKDR